MTALLDKPWALNENAERISTHGGLATIDFNGAEKERRETMRLVAQAQEMGRLLLDASGRGHEPRREGDGYPCDWCAALAPHHTGGCPLAKLLRAAGVLP